MQTMSQPQPKFSAETIHQANIRPDPYHSHLSLPNSSPQPSPQQIYRSPENWNRISNTAAESDCLLQRHGYSIHLVNSLKQRIKASTLIKRMYASRGYQTESTSVFSQFPYQYTFEARQAQQLIGTLTLTIDTERGLLADSLYQTELNHFRQKGHKLCEVSKLAFTPNSSSKEIFASLFHIAYLYANGLHDAQDAFIEVNPRHAFFYQRMLGFNQFGEQRTCPRVNAPAVLLHLDLAYMGEQITNMADNPKQKGKSIYPYFFNHIEEEAIIQHIQPKQITLHNPGVARNQQRLLFSSQY